MTSGDPENLKSDERKTSDLTITDKPFIGLRWVLVFMLFLTSFNLFFLRNSIGVIVVAMVNTTHEDDTDYSADACPDAINQTEPTNAEFDIILSRLSEKFGQRETLCLVMFSAGIITLASPWAASVSGYFFAATRFLTGISFGPAGAAFYGLLSAWAPKSEMSTMSSLGFSASIKNVPYFKILTSPYVLILVYCGFARSWLDQAVNNEGPSFFGYKIGLDLDIASYVTGASVEMPTIILLGITWTGCNSTAAIIWWILLGATSVATVSSAGVSVLDIAPNHTATVNALLGVGSLGAAIAPSAIAALVGTKNGWNKSFYVCAAINAVSLLSYVFFMTDKAQPWNFEEEQKEKTSEIADDKTAEATKL
ncbi:putative inorganic phosphate cotransporter [Armadillidium vulgare]|nr:putative inorganic phosphate cotransporter [Armadillidium vulgare]